jgi:hypothetical protein
MRRIAALVLTVSLASLGLMPSKPIQASPADSPDVNGSWKLVIIPTSDVGFAIFDVKVVDGKIAAPVTAAHSVLGSIKTLEGTVEGDRVTIQLPGAGDPTSFRGVLDKDGKKAKGSIRFQGRIFPARIERTEDKALTNRTPAPPMAQKLNLLQTIKDPKERVASLRDLIGQNPENPLNTVAYSQILSLAEPANLNAEDVGKVVGKWVDEAKAYGPEWTVEIQSQAAKALLGKKAYATLAIETAQAADKTLPADATTEQRFSVTSVLASSAKLAGKDAIAAEAEGRAKGYDAKLDAEYHEKVPPFKPGTFGGRLEEKANRVVVMEIFTGAECPPCVAADVAFDALLKTYKPTEFIGLQYHLHIPGPDPLTNTDTVARQGYYGSEISGTPSTFFNGKSVNGDGGGPMARAEFKYNEYRKEIDSSLSTEKKADIKLTATRTSDEVKISAKATVVGGSKDAKPRLRLVLVEESVRYPGGNKLRYHENVVRAFPGGVEGKELEKGEGSIETTVKLADLRKAQDAYLAAFPTSDPRGTRPFPNPIPPMDLDDLAVVALVQDDADHSIWHAVQVEVKTANP